MKIDNVKVYDLEESIIASGLPMKSEYNSDEFNYLSSHCHHEIDKYIYVNKNETTNDIKRIIKLANNPIGSGHNNALSGILVSANITATVKWWEQFQRYHFKQIVSSMSTMHRLRKMIMDNTIHFDEKTNKKVIDSFISLINDKNITDEELAYSCPMGIQLTARVNMNYLQIKTIYSQRKNHKLSEWSEDFCGWVKTLPLSKELITGE